MSLKIIDYLFFQLRAKDEYHLHSPFIFDFYTEIIQKSRSPLFCVNVFSDIRYILSSNENFSEKPFPENLSLPEGYKKIISSLTSQSQTKYILHIFFKKEKTHYILHLIDHLSLGNYTKIKEFDSLESILELLPEIKIIFFDKNIYSSENFLTSFEPFFLNAADQHIFLFENIHASKKYYLAWNKIISRKKCALSLDSYFLGFLFFNESISPQSILLKI